MYMISSNIFTLYWKLTFLCKSCYLSYSPNQYLWLGNFDWKKNPLSLHLFSSLQYLICLPNFQNVKMPFLMKRYPTLRNFYFYKIDILILVLLCFAGKKQNRGCYRVLYQESMTELLLHIKALFQSSVYVQTCLLRQDTEILINLT